VSPISPPRTPNRGACGARGLKPLPQHHREHPCHRPLSDSEITKAFSSRVSYCASLEMITESTVTQNRQAFYLLQNTTIESTCLRISIAYAKSSRSLPSKVQPLKLDPALQRRGPAQAPRPRKQPPPVAIQSDRTVANGRLSQAQPPAERGSSRNSRQGATLRNRGPLSGSHVSVWSGVQTSI
jgi:hypothetical protein